MLNEQMFVKGVPSGMPRFNPQAVTDWFGKAANNTPYPPPLTTYGYPYAETESRRAPLTPDITVSAKTYKYNAQDGNWYFEKTNSKGKVDAEPLTRGFSITCKNINKGQDGNIRFVIIEYSVNGKIFTALMPGDDYCKDSYNKYLKEIYRFPDCTKGKFNALVAFLMQSVPTKEIMLFPHQGWHESGGGVLVFASDPPQLNIPHNLVSASVARRKLSPLVHSPQEIIQNWLDIYSKDASLQFIGYYRMGSLLQFFLRRAGVQIHQYLIAEPSEGVGDDKLKAMLATNDIENYPVLTLSSDEDKILAERELVFDGISLYVDDCFADEEKKVISGIKTITKSVRKEVVNKGEGNSLTAVISKNAAYAATRLAPENVIVISTNGVEVNAAVEKIKAVTAEMDALVISTIQAFVKDVEAVFCETIPEVCKSMGNHTLTESVAISTMFFIVDTFFRRYFGFGWLTAESFKDFLTIVDCKSNRVMNACTAIEHDFSSILSGMIRSKALSPERKKKNMRFGNDGKTFILDGERIFIPPEIIEKILLEMTTTHSFDSLMRALKYTKVLETTDGNTHPVELHDTSGKHQRLYLYDISSEILDDDVLYKLHNPESESYLLTEDESKIAGFMPLIREKSGKIAGKRFVYNDAENDSIAIYGQSGEGKSYTKEQIMANRFAQGYDILVFDTSASDTYEAVCANLPQRFVDENIVFHKLDDDELHVNILDIDRTASIPSQKKELVGIITAAVGDLSVPQTNALRTVCSELLEKTDVDKPISPDYLLKLLDKEGGPYESLRNRLEPFIEDIKEYGLTNGTWKEFFDADHKIHIVQLNEGFSENGNQIVDALLAGLFNYKRENPQRPLSVFIDEVQNQNFSASSPIRKILKEGRKHHLSIVAATQDFYARGSEIGSALGKAGMQIHHRPTQNSANLVAAELRWSKADMARFDSMNRGDIVIKGALYNKEKERNMQTILNGHVVSFLSDGIIDEPDEDAGTTYVDC